MSVTIKATYDIPSKKCLWLVEVIGVNRKKFCGKKGELLKKYTDYHCQNYDDSYWRAVHAAEEQKFLIASVDDVEEGDANFSFRKIKQFSMSTDDISYQFTFGFGNSIYAKTLDELEKEISKRLQNCRKHITQANKSEESITKLLNEFNAHLKNFATQSANAESLISVKRESADSPNSPHDTLKSKEKVNFS